MKQNSISNTQKAGFTLVELLVVIAIMGSAFVVILVGLNQQRIARNIKLGQNEAVTNLRKVQSYMLSARNIGSNGAAVKFYSIRLNATDGQNGQFTIHAFDNEYNPYTLETVKLYDTIFIKQLKVESESGTAACAQVLFAAPFGKIYIDTTNCGDGIVNTLRNPVTLVSKADKKLSITLQSTLSDATKDITIYGFSGKIEGN